MSLVDILIPTFDSPQMIGPCVRSIVDHRLSENLFHIYIVNNGRFEAMKVLDSIGDRNKLYVTVLQCEKNHGWEGGLEIGLKESKARFVVFMNDDTYVPTSSSLWLNRMLRFFDDPKVAAVGPMSNCVMGFQNMFLPIPQEWFYVSYLIGFCVVIRRSALDEIGGLDVSMPFHGDDLDWSIRFRQAGYKLICDRGSFIYHHGFQTGQREHGSYWNSAEMQEKTNHWLIRKHGLKAWWQTLSFKPFDQVAQLPPDREGDLVRRYAKGQKILELGCGGRKTLDEALGVDIVKKDVYIDSLSQTKSVADVCADVQEPLPFEKESFDCIIARHILEHMHDPIKAIFSWAQSLKPNGLLILAVPDHARMNTLVVNYEHQHAYTQESLRNLMETLGWKTEALEDAQNGISFVGVFSKNGVH